MKNTQFHEYGNNPVKETIDQCERLLEQGLYCDQVSESEKRTLAEIKRLKADAKQIVAAGIAAGLLRRNAKR